ncbi:co-chaperone GroES [bacterium]|nr:co-chaperone GroES [bacterium]
MNLTPLRDRVILEPKVDEAKSKGGVILPETASKERPHEGTVLAIGTGRRNAKGDVIPMQVRKGDSVIFSEYAGTEIEIEGKKHIIVKEDDILAVL